MRALKGKIRVCCPILGIFIGFCLIVIIGAGFSRLYYTLLDAPWLKVEEIETAGLKKLDRVQVLNAMGVARGECILNLRLGPIVERLREIPAVKSASVHLDLPGRLVVDISEREPLAVLGGGDLYLVDDDGLLFARSRPEDNRYLPLITGICGPNVKEGDFIPAQHLSRVKELIAALHGTRGWLAATSTIECQWNPGGFTLVMGERGVPVEVGQDKFSQKLARLKEVVGVLKQRQWTELVTRIDLDYPSKAYLDGQFPVPKPAQGQGKQAG